jgi:hypothetical protein
VSPRPGDQLFSAQVPAELIERAAYSALFVASEPPILTPEPRSKTSAAKDHSIPEADAAVHQRNLRRCCATPQSWEPSPLNNGSPRRVDGGFEALIPLCGALATRRHVNRRRRVARRRRRVGLRRRRRWRVSLRGRRRRRRRGEAPGGACAAANCRPNRRARGAADGYRGKHPIAAPVAAPPRPPSVVFAAGFGLHAARPEMSTSAPITFMTTSHWLSWLSSADFDPGPGPITSPQDARADH